jgi:hypothetical protein
MVNQEELAVCRRRGHAAERFEMKKGWIRCKWCGMWLREVAKIEEREDTPPESEQSPWMKLEGGSGDKQAR